MTAAMEDDYGLARARQLLELNQVDSAIAALRDLLAIEPENADARAWLAQAYLAKDEPELAIEHGRAALALDPENQRAHLRLAQAYLSRRPISRSTLWDHTRRPGQFYVRIPFISGPSLWSQARAMKRARKAARPPRSPPN